MPGYGETNINLIMIRQGRLAKNLASISATFKTLTFKTEHDGQLKLNYKTYIAYVL